MNNSQPSPLVLLHPDGFIQRSLVIGENAPARLTPLDQQTTSGGPVDLILWAPSAAECQKIGYLRAASETIHARLAPDGLVYALVPVFWRARAQRVLHRKGLETGPVMAHLPDWKESRNILPLDTRSVEYAFTRQFPTRALLRSAAFAALRLPFGRRLSAQMYPYAAFVARPGGSRALFSWLYDQVGIQPEIGRASLAASWRGEHCSVVILGFDHAFEPKAAAKAILGSPGQTGPANEYHLLEQAGPAARSAGALVPKPLQKGSLGGIPVFLQSSLPGTCAAAAVARHPEKVVPTLERITRWLAAWNLATAVPQPLDQNMLHQSILEPLESVTSLLAHSAGYRDWLVERIQQLTSPVTLVDAHNDLTLWNILLQPDGSIGVIDWSEACPSALPLGDLFYLFVDAVSVAYRFDHDRAFLEVLEPGGRYYRFFRATLARMQQALGLSTSLTQLSLHACFLHHAANEHRQRLPGEDRPFARVVRWLEINRQSIQVGER